MVKAWRKEARTANMDLAKLAVWWLNHDCKEWGVLPQILKNFLKMSDDELQSELAVLEDSGLIYYGENWINEKRFHYVTLSWYTINGVVNWAKDNNISLKKLFNTMDFTELDE